VTVDQLGRAYEAYRRTAGSRSVVAVLFTNTIPLVGVLLFGWSLLTILVIYWIENGIVGVWNVPRIVLAQGSFVPTLPELPEGAALAATRSPEAAENLQATWQAARARQLAAQQAAPNAARTGAVPNRLAGVSRIGLSVFFAFHYGVFWVVHGLFVFTLPSFGNGFGLGSGACFDELSGFPAPCAAGAFGEVNWSNVAIAAAALFLSHGASFLFNYVGRGEYLTSSPGGQMAAPYGRVITLHVTIIFGAFAIAIIGAPLAALLILVGVKTAFDLMLHVRAHRREGPSIHGVAPAS